MKKILALSLVLVMVFSLTSCGLLSTINKLKNLDLDARLEPGEEEVRTTLNSLRAEGIEMTFRIQDPDQETTVVIGSKDNIEWCVTTGDSGTEAIVWVHTDNQLKMYTGSSLEDLTEDGTETTETDISLFDTYTGFLFFGQSMAIGLFEKGATEKVAGRDCTYYEMNMENLFGDLDVDFGEEGDDIVIATSMKMWIDNEWGFTLRMIVEDDEPTEFTVTEIRRNPAVPSVE